MEVIDDEVLRVTPAYRCFEQCAIALHGSEVKQGKLFFTPRKKLITLMVTWNGYRARSLTVRALCLFLVVGSIFAAADSVDDPRIRWSYAFVKWSSCFVPLVEWLLIFFLRPEIGLVFLDQICIKQQDNAMKANTILSLAGIMKRSDSMLILWDPTWTEGLRSLVELAAFLKSRQNPEEQLIIRPIFVGPVYLVGSLTGIGLVVTLLPAESDTLETRTILLPPLSYLTQHFLPFLLCALTAAYAGVSALRSYFRSVESMQQRLLSISFDETRCYCCDRNHVSPPGKPMLCDRKVFAHCIIHWFGGQDTFEDILRTEVRKAMVNGLREHGFKACFRAAMRPLLCGSANLFFIELASSIVFQIRKEESYSAQHADNAASCFWNFLGGFFIISDFEKLVDCACKHTQARPNSHRLEFAKNAAIVAALSIPIFGVMACVVLINDDPGFEWKVEAWHRHL
eukprot:Skav218711  [mRNA]  locus=scaffold1346:455156:456923:- [translate_table: standard]